MKHYFIDYENVHDSGLNGIDKIDKDSIIYLLYSDVCKNVSIAFLEKVINKEIQVKLYKTETGKNALDFQLSSYLGFLIGQDFTDFCIVSKDCGYDSIIDFWKNEKNISIEKQSFSDQGKSISNQKDIKNGNKTTPTQTDTDIEKVLSNSTVKLKQNEIKEVTRIFNQYKTKQAINSNLQKYFKDNEKVGAIYKFLKPFLKNKK